MAELSRELGVPETQKREFRSFIKDMAGAGTLIKIRGGRYGLPDEMNLVTGKLHGHPNGFGFVIPDHQQGGKRCLRQSPPHERSYAQRSCRG